jgi:hypothetical protein
MTDPRESTPEPSPFAAEERSPQRMKMDRQMQLDSHAWLVGRLPVFEQAIRTWEALGLELPVEGVEEPLTAAVAMLEADGLSRLLRVYNEAVWNDLPYCRACGGHCCSHYIAGVGGLDAAMLALLGLPAPHLPDPLPPLGQCVYRSPDGCAWPPGWKSLTCALFFCPGQPGPDKRGTKPYPSDWFDNVLVRLDDIIDEGLSPTLFEWQYGAGSSLSPLEEENPLDLAEVFEEACFDVFLFPINDYFPSTDKPDEEGEWVSLPGFPWQDGSKGYHHFLNYLSHDETPKIEQAMRRLADDIGATYQIHHAGDAYPPLSALSKPLAGRPPCREIITDGAAFYVDEAHFEEYCRRRQELYGPVLLEDGSDL